ncbi:MAG TPA: YHS domain-containing protein [Acidobacteriota bacterium]|nr:YHS domain-containing protein [Acidobacteriota bacterium]
MDDKEETTESRVDPVCGMEVDAESTVGSSEYGGRTYYFCSEDCKEAFDAVPGQYV